MSTLYVPNHVSLDAGIASLAGSQHGVFTRGQAIGLGATRSEIGWRLKTGRWTSVRPRVYAVAGAQHTWQQKALAVCLFLGDEAVISHEAAAAHTNVAGFARGRIVVTIPARRNRPSSLRDVKIHVTKHPLLPSEITRIDGILVTRPARTLLDLAATSPKEKIEIALDDLLRRRVVTIEYLTRRLSDPRRAPHRGTKILRGLLENHPGTESPLERRVLPLLLAETDLPRPVCQYEVFDGEAFLGRLDFAYPEHKVGIEPDGFEFHDGRAHFDEERTRTNGLEAAGWRVLRLTSAHTDEEIRRWVRRALTGSST